MTCVANPTLQAQLTAKLAQLEVAQASLEDALLGNIQEYRLNTNEGDQRVERLDIKDLMKVVDILERQISWLQRKLSCGGGLTSIKVRRGM